MKETQGFSDNSNDIEALAMEITSYLKQYPKSSDSLMGIARWWLTQQRIEVAMENVSRALEYLEEKGIVEKVLSADGSSQYKLTNSDTSSANDH